MWTIDLPFIPPSNNTHLNPLIVGGVRKKRRVAMVKSEEHRNFAASIQKWWARAGFGASKPLTGLVRLDVIFWVPRMNLDRSNMLKALEDALKALAWVDDQQIVDGPTSKRLGKPRTLCRIFELSPTTDTMNMMQSLAKSEQRRRTNVSSAPGRLVARPVSAEHRAETSTGTPRVYETLAQRLNRLATPNQRTNR